MEQNLVPLTPKRLWQIVCVVLFLIRKNLSKTKITLDAKYLKLKRGKVIAKVVNHFMFPHQHRSDCSSLSKGGPYTGHLPCSTPPKEYVFSCSNTPYHHLVKLRRNHHVDCFQFVDDRDENLDAVKGVLDMIVASTNHKDGSVAELSGSVKPTFEQSPLVQELQVTDSPFVLRSEKVDNHVDEAAEEFIKRFYSQLREQDC